MAAVSGVVITGVAGQMVRHLCKGVVLSPTTTTPPQLFLSRRRKSLKKHKQKAESQTSNTPKIFANKIEI